MRSALMVILVAATLAHADVSAPSLGQVTGAVFATHPGGWERAVVWLRVTLRRPGECTLSAAIGERRLDVQATATGFNSTIAPPPREGDRLAVGCDGALRDTGIVFSKSKLREEGW